VSGLTDALWERYRGAGDLGARAELLECYLGLVHHSARELAARIGHHAEVDDLVGAGTIGLVEALEGFDRSRGLAFSTYAMPRIRGAMLDQLRSLDWTPRVIRERARRLAGARHRLQGELGRPPEETELAAALGVDLETFRHWRAESEERVLVALEQAVDADSGDTLSLSETIADRDAPLPGEELAREQSILALRAGFAELGEKDRLVLSLYYFEQLNLRQIGEVLHVTESRISQIHNRALKRLRACTLLTGEDA
jgi:RNA polymerase sigma factor for flagellar operon FliA